MNHVVPADPPPSVAPPSSQYTDPSSNIHVLAFAPFESALPFLAVGTDDRVDVLKRDYDDPGLVFKPFKSFRVSSPVTALTWSDRSVAPAAETPQWNIEIAAISRDNHIRLLASSSRLPTADVFDFGTQDGHKGRINDVSFCKVRSGDDILSLASVGDDKSLIIWAIEIDEDTVLVDELLGDPSDSLPARFVSAPIRIYHSNRLVSVTTHPNVASGLLVASAAGELFEYVSVAEGKLVEAIEVVAPKRLANALEGRREGYEEGSADWCPDNSNLLGALFGQHWYIWNLDELMGSGPTLYGDAHSRPGHKFKWCPINPFLFATASFDPVIRDAIIIYDIRFPETPTTLSLVPGGEPVRGFDWSREGQWMAVARGRNILFVPVEGHSHT